MTPEEFKIQNDFLLKDYELKVKYLTDHFQRKWTRFNYFVTIELAITGGRFIIGDGKFSMELAIVGASLSLIWYIFGAEDRYLVRVYRKHIEKGLLMDLRGLYGTKIRKKRTHIAMYMRWKKHPESYRRRTKTIISDGLSG